MRRDSSLSAQQRRAAVSLFEAGHGAQSVATRIGGGERAVSRLYDRWRLHGGDALVPKATKRTISFEVKRDIVQRFLAGETTLALAREFDLSSPKLIEAWVRIYRKEGEDGLRPKPKGRPRRAPDAPGRELSEVEQLRQEVERLRAEVAYLGKLKALTASKRR